MSKLPGPYSRFIEQFPSCGAGYEKLANVSREAAGFETRDAELLKLALAIGSRLEGAVHSHTRRAREAGASAADVRGVAILGLTTLGFPQTMMGLSWVEDVLRDEGDGASGPAAGRKKEKKAGKKGKKKGSKGRKG